jgi:hypothetical protein
MRIRHLAVLITSLLSSACHIGQSAASYGPATRAEGVTMIITTDAGRFTGELVEVKDNGIVALLSDGRVALVPWSATTNAVAQGVPGTSASYGFKMQPGREARVNLIMMSHFPQGMTPEIQERFLAGHKQAEIVVIQ